MTDDHTDPPTGAAGRLGPELLADKSGSTRREQRVRGWVGRT
jgi:hypothetical protein